MIFSLPLIIIGERKNQESEEREVSGGKKVKQGKRDFLGLSINKRHHQNHLLHLQYHLLNRQCHQASLLPVL